MKIVEYLEKGSVRVKRQQNIMPVVEELQLAEYLEKDYREQNVMAVVEPLQLAEYLAKDYRE